MIGQPAARAQEQTGRRSLALTLLVESADLNRVNQVPPHCLRLGISRRAYESAARPGPATAEQCCPAPAREKELMPLRDKTIAVIGAGNMGEALVRGLLVSKAIEPHQLIAADVRAHRLEQFSTQFGIEVVDDNSAAVADADIVLLAVKPQQMAEVLRGLRGRIPREKLLISILSLIH